MAGSVRRVRTLRPAALAVAVLVALGLAFAFVLATADGPATVSGRLGGDFPEFYGAGRIAAAGDLDRLYDPAVQAASQRDLLPPAGPGVRDYIAFPYPPAVAELYRPFAAVPYRVAYGVHTALMVAAAAVGLSVVPLGPRFGEERHVVALAVLLTCLPAAVGIFLGQNAGLSLLCLALAWRFADRRQDLAAGLALGALCFKPQLAVPLVLLLVVGRRWRSVAGFAGVAALWWAASAAVAGIGWVGPFLRQASALRGGATNEPAHTLSIPAVTSSLLGSGSAAAVLGYALAAAVGGLVAWLWLQGRGTLHDRWALGIVATVLCTPHLLYYDVALVCPALVALHAAGRLTARTVALLVLAATAAHAASSALGTSPLVLVVLALGVVAVRPLLRSPAPAG